jgi:peptide/nickel transport system permease protein
MPGAAIVVTVLALNLIGDGLSEALDPRSSRDGGR